MFATITALCLTIICVCDGRHTYVRLLHVKCVCVFCPREAQLLPCLGENADAMLKKLCGLLRARNLGVSLSIPGALSLSLSRATQGKLH